MAVNSTESFGQYTILSQIGAGGMGEVFLAHDTKLDRKVAIKFLADQFAAEPERLSRFIQEAKAASALNHPNIITIHEIGETDGTNYIATEFIDGRTLRERLSDEHLSFDDVLSFAIQVAEALTAAHAAGIVHRDIKPENIMLRADGYLKVLDFGLAKLAENGADSEPEEATRKLVKTSPGVVMGTASYMSPEQARGTDIDARSDVFSFGVVLYEMISGRKPFEGDTTNDTIAAILTKEPPPLSSLAPGTPKELQRIINKTLRKNRDKRYNSTKDLLGDLKDLHEELMLEAKREQTSAPNAPAINSIVNPPDIGQSRTSTTSGSGKDAILLTEFDNQTGDPVFDSALKMALAFSLEQSPVLDIIAETKVRQTLRLMGRSADEWVTKDIGREICQRQGLKAYITGSIALFGTLYVLTLEAINTQTGESIGRQFEQAPSKEQVLAVLGQAANGLRQKLGETLSSIERFDAPFEFTTSSLEAIKVYSLGREMLNHGKTLEAIPFYKKAIELDQNFASVYSGLAVIYANTNQWKLAAEFAAKAYELRETVSEHEKLRITCFYYAFLTGEIDKQIETLELWKQTYPKTPLPFINLADCYERIGQSEKASVAAREAIRLDSSNAVAYMNLAESLLSLSRFDDAEETCKEAFEKKFDGDFFHLFLYQTSFIKSDTKAMAEQLAWFSGQSDEYLALNLQTSTAAFLGQWRWSQDFARRAIDLASRNNAKEVSAQYAAEQALRIVFWSSGSGLPEAGDDRLRSVLKTQTNNALRFERSSSTLSLAALALALAGYETESNELVGELRSDYSKHTFVNDLWLPMIRAAFCLQNGRAKDAVEELETAERLEKAADFYPQYIRGLAFLKLDKPKRAAAEFDKILNNRGEAPLSAVYPLAQLGKARATKNKEDYEKFFELWKDADADMPALVAAKTEFADL